MGVEQTPRKSCIDWKAQGGAAHAGRYEFCKFTKQNHFFRREYREARSREEKKLCPIAAVRINRKP
ncbi:MAG: hypothetical protein R6V46_06520, partial [Desulfatiglandaceae bacterium]